jgi:hypothetical protein
MALERELCGFEIADVQIFAGVSGGYGTSTLNINVDAPNARTGACYLRVAPPGGAGRHALMPAGSVAGVSSAVANGSRKRIRSRVYLRVNSFPGSGIGSPLRIYAIGGPFNGHAVLWLRSDGLFALNMNGGALTWSAGALSVGVWYRAVLDVDYLAGATTTTVSCSVRLTTDSDTPPLDETIAGSWTLGTTTFGTGTPTFGNNGADFNPPASVDYDDLVYFAADGVDATAPLVLPNETKVLPVAITGTAQQDWETGTYLDVDEVPVSMAASWGDFMEASTAGVGATVLFSHLPAASLGIGAVIAWKVWAMAGVVSTGSSVIDTILNGNTRSQTYPAVGYGSAMQVHGVVDWAGYSSAQFDVITFGVVKRTAVGTRLGNIISEVLYATPADLGEVVPVVADDLSGLTTPLVWVEWTLDSGAIESYAKVPLCDPPTYYGGYKRPLILSWGEVKRALSDRTGQVEGAAFSWVASDLDRRIRSLLFGLTTRYNFVNRTVIARMISDIDRRANRQPRTIFRGILRNYDPKEELKFEFNAEDFLAAKLSPFNLDKVIPRRLIGDVFADAPVDARKRPIPIIYGEASDESATGNVPILFGTAALGGYSDSGSQVFGHGHLTSSVVVTGIGTPTLTAGAGGSGTLSADVPNGEYGIIVTGVDGSGRESDPVPYFTDVAGNGRGAFPASVPHVTVDGTQKVTASWTAATGAVKYRVYLGYYYYGFRPTQMIETVATSCDFTSGPAWQGGSEALSPGATTPPFGQFWYYAVSAKFGDGTETGLSAVGFAITRGYRRPHAIEWVSVAGAISYSIFRRGAVGDFDRRWDYTPANPLAATQEFDDDLLDTNVIIINGAPVATGVVPLTYIGVEVVSGFPWHRYLVQHGCAKEVTSLFVDGKKIDSGNYGVTWLAPGKSGWPLAHNYVDVNGTRCTVVYGRGPQSDAIVNGSSSLSGNVKGLEAVGDGSGTLITSLLQIYKHFIVNFGFQNSNGGIGGWLSAPLWEVGVSQVDTTSFDTADAVAATRLAGGFTGAAVIGANDELITLREIIKRFNVSADVRSGFNRNSQFFVTMLDTRVATIAAAREITQLTNILKSSFSIEEQVDELYNVAVYSYARDFKQNKWRVESEELPDADSITNYRETKKTSALELWFVRSASVALQIMTRAVLFTRHVPRRVVWDEPLSGLSSELGDVVRLTHLDGVGPNGYTGVPLWVDRHDFDPNAFKVRFEAYDVYRLFAGGFVLGDDTWAVSWPTATPQERLYGFLCNESTGTFSDGTEGKRLR